MKQAHIRCPHCGHSITVRQSDIKNISPENVEKIWAAADEAFKAADVAFAAMDRAFRKIFHPSLWKNK